MKLNIAIAGYGNLGKSLEANILKDKDLNLRAVFSRRYLDNAKFAPMQDAAKFVGKIDVVMLALGSYNDIAENCKFFAPFHTVDSYDTHSKIAEYKKLLNDVKPNTISVCATGWDPGTLSLARGIFDIDGSVTTFWGRGISQGHSNALRSIGGVLDAVEITEPKDSAVDLTTGGENVAENERHKRLCYVCCVESDKDRVEKEIRNMPNYFAGQETEIVFCSCAEIRKLKENTAHKGTVIANGNGYKAKLALEVASNTDFTAKIMLRYAKAIPQLLENGYMGALDPFDIPLKYVAAKNLI